MFHETNHDACGVDCQPNSVRSAFVQPSVLCTALLCLTVAYAVRQYCAAQERAEKMRLIATYGVSATQQKLFRDIITETMSRDAGAHKK